MLLGENGIDPILCCLTII